MARAFWFSLMIGYLAGAFAAAIYLPRAVLQPSLANLALLTGFSTLFVLVVSFRAWRGRDPSQPNWPWQKAIGGRVGVRPAGPTAGHSLDAQSELLLEPIHEQTNFEQRPMANPSSTPHSDEFDHEQVYASARELSADLSPDVRQRVRIEPPSTNTEPDLLCLAERVVSLPQRRLLGHHIRAALAEGAGRFGRQDMIARGLDWQSIQEFDRAVMARATKWLERQTDGSAIGSTLMIDLQLAALRSRRSRRLLDDLAAAANRHEIGLVLVLDQPNPANLPRLKAQSIGPRVEFLLRTGTTAPPRGLLASGFAGVALARADLEPYLQLPLKDDPIFARLQLLDQEGGRIVMQGFGVETQLRDVLDYPCHQASGTLFGETLAVTELPARAPRKIVNPGQRASDQEQGATLDQLRAQMGYGAATTLNTAAIE